MRFIRVLFFCFLVVSSINIFAQKEEATYGNYLVKQGDNLFRISRSFFLKEQDIMDINPGLSAETLKSGETIKIPLTSRNKALLKPAPIETSQTITSSPITKTTNNSIAKKYKSKKHLNIAMMLPLAYNRIDELNFSKYNIEEKKKAKYKSFEYITFFEGARIALNRLESEGYSVSLYVYDVGEDDISAMNETLNLPQMKTMDLIIPLVFQKSFNLTAEFSNKNNIPIINPMSFNLSILNNNPYLFKIQPSPAAEIETIMRYIKNNFTNPNIILLYTPNATEKPLMEYYKKLFEKDNNISWTIIDYNKFSNRITEKLSVSKDNIYISIVDKGNPKANEGYANGVLSVLNNQKKVSAITLFAPYNWIDFGSIDLRGLQNCNYHFTLSYLNDYTNINFVNFVKEYRKHFKAEPDKIYAALGYDIISYFVPIMSQKGNDFIEEPNYDNTKSMINPYFFERKDNNTGYQNKRTVVYKINDYKIQSVGR